jgi:hypothetical protein
MREAQNDEAWPCCVVMCVCTYVRLLLAHAKRSESANNARSFLSQSHTCTHSGAQTHTQTRTVHTKTQRKRAKKATECEDTIERCVQNNIQPAGIAKSGPSKIETRKHNKQECQADSPSTTSATSSWPFWRIAENQQQQSNRLGSRGWTVTCAMQSW